MTYAHALVHLHIYIYDKQHRKHCDEYYHKCHEYDIINAVHRIEYRPRKHARRCQYRCWQHQTSTGPVLAHWYVRAQICCMMYHSKEASSVLSAASL